MPGRTVDLALVQQRGLGGHGIALVQDDDVGRVGQNQSQLMSVNPVPEDL